MNLKQNDENSLVAEQLVVSQGGLSSMELLTVLPGIYIRRKILVTIAK
jgi:hypothetical protein